jgi:hypothetical protein
MHLGPQPPCLSEMKTASIPKGDNVSKRYRVTFVDSTKTKVNATNRAEAKQKAESEHGKPVAKVREYGTD